MRFNMRKDICAIMMASVVAVGNVGVASATEININIGDEYVETLSFDDVATVSSDLDFEYNGFSYRWYDDLSDAKAFIISEYNGTDEELYISTANNNESDNYISEIVQLTKLSDTVKKVIIDADMDVVSMNSFSGKNLEYIRFLDDVKYDESSDDTVSIKYTDGSDSGTIICDIQDIIGYDANGDVIVDSSNYNSPVVNNGYNKTDKTYTITTDNNVTLTDVIIQGYPGTFAEAYAKKKGLTFESLDSLKFADVYQGYTYDNNDVYSKDSSITIESAGEILVEKTDYKILDSSYNSDDTAITYTIEGLGNYADQEIEVTIKDGTGIAKHIDDDNDNYNCKIYYEDSMITNVVDRGDSESGSLDIPKLLEAGKPILGIASGAFGADSFISKPVLALNINFWGYLDKIETNAFTSDTNLGNITFAGGFYDSTIPAIGVLEDEAFNSEANRYTILCFVNEIQGNPFANAKGSSIVYGSNFWGTETDLCPNYKYDDGILYQKDLTGNSDYDEIINVFNSTSSETLSIPSNIKTIRRQAFAGNTTIKTLTIEDSSTEIEESAFAKSSINNFTASNGLGTINKYAFEETPLVKFDVDGDIEEISDYAFFNAGTTIATNSFSVNIDGNVGNIGESAFEHDKTANKIGYLSSFTVTGTTGDIGTRAFHGCSSLSNLCFTGDVSSISKDVFYGYNTLGDLKFGGDIKNIEPEALTELTTYASFSSGYSLECMAGTNLHEYIQGTSVPYVANITDNDNVVLSEIADQYFDINGEQIISTNLVVKYTDGTSEILVYGDDYTYVIEDRNGGEDGYNESTNGTAKDKQLVITGNGEYTGTITSDPFTLHSDIDAPTPISDAIDVTINYENDYDYCIITLDEVNSNTKIEPDYTLTIADGTTLTEGTDYKVYYTNNASQGVATLCVEGMGEYGGIIENEFNIYHLIEEKMVYINPTLFYNGSANVGLGVYAHDTSGGDLPAGKMLTVGTHYTATLTSGDNVNVGKFEIEVNGNTDNFYVGQYKAENTISSFDIDAYPTFPPTIEVSINDQAYDESKSEYTLSPEDITITITSRLLYGDDNENKETPRTLTKDDYSITYENNTTMGEATAKIELKGNYSGTLDDQKFSIIRSVETATIDGIDEDGYVHTGNSITIEDLTVTIGDKTLIENTDYIVSYDKNTDVGEATVTITGIGIYSGEVIKTFNIKQSISDASITVADNYTYNGDEITVNSTDLTVELNGDTLTYGTDYEIVGYSNNTNAGTATITIKGIGTKYAETATGTFTINKADQTALSIVVPTEMAIDSEADITISGGDGDGEVTVTSSNENVLTVSGDETNGFKVESVGTVANNTTTLTVSKLGDDNYNDATEVNSSAISVVDKSLQADLEFDSSITSNTTIKIDDEFDLIATGGESSINEPVTFASSNENIIKITGDATDGYTATALAEGSVIITATKAGNSSYTDVSSSIIITVEKLDQTISHTIPSSITKGATLDLIDYIVKSDSTGELLIVIESGNDYIEIDPATNILTAKEIGNSVIKIQQVGDDKYNVSNELNVEIEVTSVPKSEQDELVFTVTSPITVGDEITLTTTGGSGDGEVTFASSDDSVLSITGNTATAVSAGTVTITATKDGDNDYNSATKTAEITVNAVSDPSKSEQDELVFTVTSPITVGDEITLTTTGGSGDGEVTFASSDDSVLSITGNTATAVSAGTVTITATKDGDNDYNSATKTAEVTVNAVSDPSKSEQDELMFTVTSPVTVGDEITLTTTGGSGTGEVTFASSDDSVLSIIGNIATAKSAGAVTITATKDGDNDYNSATKTAEVIVNAQTVVDPTPTPDPTPDVEDEDDGNDNEQGDENQENGDDDNEKLPQDTLSIVSNSSVTVGNSIALTTTGGSGTGEVTYTSSNPSVLRISGNVATGVKSGSATITATKASDDEYDSISATKSVTVNSSSGSSSSNSSSGSSSSGSSSSNNNNYYDDYDNSNNNSSSNSNSNSNNNNSNNNNNNNNNNNSGDGNYNSSNSNSSDKNTMTSVAILDIEVSVDEDTNTTTKVITYSNNIEVTQEISADGEVYGEITGVSDSTLLTLPLDSEPSITDVAVIVNADGSREIIKDTVIDGEGLRILIDSNATIEIIDNAKDFKDIVSDSWYEDAVLFVTSRELFSGMGDEVFAPEDTMTRAMIWTVLFNYQGENVGVAGDNWYGMAQKWAMEFGISDGTNPDGEMTREQLAALLYRLDGATYNSGNSVANFADSSKISDWAVESMNWAVSEGIIAGSGENLNPEANATRAEVAAILMRYISK